MSVQDQSTRGSGSSAASLCPVTGTAPAAGTAGSSLRAKFARNPSTPPAWDTRTAQVRLRSLGVDVGGVTDVFLWTGNSSECPPPENAPDTTVCLDSGQCLSGECVPFCQAVLKLQPCACNGNTHTHTLEEGRLPCELTVSFHLNTHSCIQSCLCVCFGASVCRNTLVL